MRNFSGSQVVYNCVYDTHNIKVSSVKRTWSVALGRGWKPVTIWIVAASYHYVASCLPLRNCVTTVDDRGKIFLWTSQITSRFPQDVKRIFKLQSMKLGMCLSIALKMTAKSFQQENIAIINKFCELNNIIYIWRSISFYKT